MKRIGKFMMLMSRKIDILMNGSIRKINLKTTKRISIEIKLNMISFQRTITRLSLIQIFGAVKEILLKKRLLKTMTKFLSPNSRKSPKQEERIY